MWHRCHDKFLGLRGDFIVTLYNLAHFTVKWYSVLVMITKLFRVGVAVEARILQRQLELYSLKMFMH